MNKIKIATSFNIELEFETAEFHKRLFAWLIDLAIITAYLIIVNKILNAYISSNKSTAYNNMPFAYNISSIGLILYTPVLLYHLICELMLNGQSVGKKLMSIKVISETGGRPALHQFLLRWLLRSIDFGFSLGVAALLSTLINRKGQRLGDLAAGTLVIKTKLQSSLNDTVFFELDSNYQPRYKNVLRLSDRDMNVIKGILDTSVKHNNYELAQRTSDKIKSVLKINDTQHPVEFLETVLKDYNYLSNQN